MTICAKVTGAVRAGFANGPLAMEGTTVVVVRDKYGQPIVVGDLAVGQVPGGGQVTGRVIAVEGRDIEIQDEGSADEGTYECRASDVVML